MGVAAATKLREALGLLRSGGWVKGTLGKRTGDTGPYNQVCAIGAVRLLLYGDPYAYPETNALDSEMLKALEMEIPRNAFAGQSVNDRIVQWNDASERTFEEVEAWFESAARRAETA